MYVTSRSLSPAIEISDGTNVHQHQISNKYNICHCRIGVQYTYPMLQTYYTNIQIFTPYKFITTYSIQQLVMVVYFLGGCVCGWSKVDG